MAPSPTGLLHLGHAKGYLINYALAKSVDAEFILRIEDSDQKKNKMETVENIIDDCEWMGIKFDKGPKKGELNEYFQSQRLPIYQKYIQQLLDEGKAYKAYETPEEREGQIKEQREKKLPPVYNGAHANLTKEEQEKFEAEGRKPVIRLRVPKDKVIKFKDAVFGEIEVNTNTFGDFVIQKSDGFPMYNFAVAVDDHEMGVTDVVRGRQHISNTPKQIVLYETFGWEIPHFVHFSDLLNENEPGKLSKRFGAKSISSYRAEGYLSEAIFNYIVIISTSFHFQNKEEEIMSLKEIFNQISEDKILKTNSKFNSAKLDWVNGQHIRRLGPDDFYHTIMKWLENDATEIKKFSPDFDESKIQLFISNKELLKQALPLVQERITKFSDIFEYLNFFFEAPVPENVDITKSRHTKEEFDALVPNLYNAVNNLNMPWNHEEWESAIRAVADEYNWKHGDAFMALRLMLVGSPFSPPLFEAMDILGKEETLSRIKNWQ